MLAAVGDVEANLGRADADIAEAEAVVVQRDMNGERAGGGHGAT